MISKQELEKIFTRNLKGILWTLLDSPANSNKMVVCIPAFDAFNEIIKSRIAAFCRSYGVDIVTEVNTTQPVACQPAAGQPQPAAQPAAEEAAPVATEEEETAEVADNDVIETTATEAAHDVIEESIDTDSEQNQNNNVVDKADSFVSHKKRGRGRRKK